MSYNLITAAIAIIGLSMVARGFIPLLWMRYSPWVTWATVGIAVLALVTATRLFYWDMLRALIGQDWVMVRDKLGGQEFSAVFNVGTIIACYMLLRARLLLIPEEHRAEWHWWNAWLHPAKSCLLYFYRKRK